MVKVKEDLTGKIFHRLTVKRQAEDYISPTGRHLARWVCECSCDNKTEIIVLGSKLKNGNTQSCGCLQKERADKKENLRKATHQQNSCNRSLRKDNTSGVTGVYFDKTNNNWYASITIFGKHIKLGTFANKEDAIKARLNAEVKYFKEFAPQSELYEEYNINKER